MLTHALDESQGILTVKPEGQLATRVLKSGNGPKLGVSGVMMRPCRWI